jgi:hypothetical protein
MKPFNDELNIIMMNIYIWEMITGGKSFPCKTFLVRVINQLYICNVKEILTEPTRRFSHTNVIFKNTCHLQQDRTNPEYSIVLRKTYPSEEKKRLRGYARLSGLWVIATAGSITKGASLYLIFISSHR